MRSVGDPLADASEGSSAVQPSAPDDEQVERRGEADQRLDRPAGVSDEVRSELPDRLEIDQLASSCHGDGELGTESLGDGLRDSRRSERLLRAVDSNEDARGEGPAAWPPRKQDGTGRFVKQRRRDGAERDADCAAVSMGTDRDKRRVELLDGVQQGRS